jgi:hypothetical protein
MPLNNGKHIIKVIDGVRCTVIETGISEDRMLFLKKVLEHNNLDVKTEKEPKKDESLPDTYSVGVTDIVFNPVIAVYERKLRTLKDQVLTAQYWKQLTDESKGWYWKF